VGYVCVYELPGLVESDSTSGWSKTYFRQWVGEPNALGPVSPNRLADRIKVPVLLVAGGEDTTAPIAQTKLMERALVAAKVPVETLYNPTEGHGFYLPAHRKEFYTRLLAFLNRNIGGGLATTAAAVPAAAGK
jgi:dipeptidyl aminopeptidase/acylaminoacyl peptidase